MREIKIQINKDFCRFMAYMRESGNHWFFTRAFWLWRFRAAIVRRTGFGKLWFRGKSVRYLYHALGSILDK